MCSSVVVSLFKSDLLEAAVNDLVECRHASVTNCHPTTEPVKHYTQISTTYAVSATVPSIANVIVMQYTPRSSSKLRETEKKDETFIHLLSLASPGFDGWGLGGLGTGVLAQRDCGVQEQSPADGRGSGDFVPRTPEA